MTNSFAIIVLLHGGMFCYRYWWGFLDFYRFNAEKHSIYNDQNVSVMIQANLEWYYLFHGI